MNILTEEEWLQWIGVFDAISIRKQIGSLNGIRFIVHTKEHGHNKPHIHAEYQGRDVVIEIETGKILKGSIPLKNETAAQKWVLAHDSLIKKNWNELVDGAITIV